MEDIKQTLSRYPALLWEIEQAERELEKTPAALREAVRERIRALREQALRIRRAVEAVPQPKLRLVLKCRYLEGMTFEEAAEALYMSERHIYRLHSEALKEVRIE